MVFTKHTLRLTVDNYLNELCDVFDKDCKTKNNGKTNDS